MDRHHERLIGGELNAAIANEIGRLIALAVGRGATRSRAFVSNDVVVCLLQDSATAAERTLIHAGRSDMVRAQRDTLQRAVEPQLVAAVERLAGRGVTEFLSGSSTPGVSQVEVFVLEPADDDDDHGGSRERARSLRP